jgi:hypothetical protein
VPGRRRRRGCGPRLGGGRRARSAGAPGRRRARPVLGACPPVPGFLVLAFGLPPGVPAAAVARGGALGGAAREGRIESSHTARAPGCDMGRRTVGSLSDSEPTPELHGPLVLSANGVDRSTSPSSHPDRADERATVSRWPYGGEIDSGHGIGIPYPPTWTVTEGGKWQRSRSRREQGGPHRKTCGRTFRPLPGCCSGVGSTPESWVTWARTSNAPFSWRPLWILTFLRTVGLGVRADPRVHQQGR